jgi:Tol biopolymer transport system component
MSLAPGVRLGAYEIVALIGAGGMGEVYRARDTRLNRDVAIKILPDLFAADADRIARFQREAQLLASLDHPNIAHIYGFEHAETARALVLELVDGSTLADVIAQAQGSGLKAQGGAGLPLDQALPIARQIADALEAAHEHGIMHRDLKPANIKVKDDGTVKVLDFGLAKALEQGSGIRDRGSVDATQSPTITSPALMTGSGVILGTAAYMSPEQAKGKPLDKRTDIWAFGCVLYEMLTGTRAFEGEDVAETIAAIIHKEPTWTALPAVTPPAVRVTLQRCLQKDPKQRLRDIGDVRLALDGSFETGATPGVAPSQRRWRRVAVLAGGVLAAALATGIAVWTVARPAPPVLNQVRFQVQPPENNTFNAAGFAVSPDGRHLAFQATDATGRSLLWLHSFETGGSRPLSRTPTNVPFWSPDSRYVVFYGDGKLRKIDIDGGPLQTICDVPGGVPVQGSWNRDDVIIFGRFPGTLMRVAAGGGTPTPLTVLNASRQEVQHSAPRFLPDGKHFVYTRVSKTPENSGIFIGSLDVKPDEQDSRMLAATSLGPAYAPSSDPRFGYLLYIREGTLLARALDNTTLQLTGEAIPVAEQIGDNGISTGFFAASATGVLAYRRSAGTDGSLVWVDRNGHEMTPLVPGVLKQPEFPRLSPDGRRLALTLARDVWVYDVEGRPPIKLTFDGNHFAPLWTPDGRRLIYESSGDPSQLRSMAADASGGTPEPVSPEGHYHPHGWSADGRSLIAVRLGTAKTGNDIVRIPIGEKGDPQPIVQTAASEGASGAALSPDGRWMAYVSDVTGQREVWVQPFPGPGAPIRVSPNGGIEPVWSRNGRELYYLEASKMMAVAVDARAGFSFKPPTLLFESHYIQLVQPPSYDVAADGRFLMIKPADTSAAGAPFTVVLNWQEALKPRVPAR